MITDQPNKQLLKGEERCALGSALLKLESWWLPSSAVHILPLANMDLWCQINVLELILGQFPVARLISAIVQRS